MDIIHLFLVFTIGIISGSYGTITGGASLVSIPTLIFLGLPAHIAIGTNRLGALGLNLAGWYTFHKLKNINYRIGIPISIAAVIGSLIGASLVLELNDSNLRKAIAFMTILGLLIIMLNPKIGIEPKQIELKKNTLIIGTFLIFLVGIYGGVYGALSGTFLSFILIFIFGETFLESAGTRKIAQVLLSSMAVLVFCLGKIINYPLAITLFLGMAIGSYMGARFSHKIGNIWIKRILLVVIFIMSIKLLIQ